MTVTYILAVLSQSDIVINVEVVEMNVKPTVQSLRAKATLKRGYVLYMYAAEDLATYSGDECRRVVGFSHALPSRYTS